MAIAAYWMLLNIGITTIRPVDGEDAPGSPAAEAGFTSGDQIVAVADEATPGWQNVALTIIEKTLDEDRVPVEVKDVQGERHVRMLRLTDVQKKLERGNLLETLGIAPARPALPPVIGSLEAGGAGAAAGMKAGDRVVAIDGEPVGDREDWVAYVRAPPEQVIRTGVVSGGARLVYNITPKLRATKEGDIGYVVDAV